jgi:Mg2+ and Co2+ transporter CorA
MIQGAGKSLNRLNASREKYAALGEALGQAGEVFKPLVQDLNGQILFLRRDHSAEAVADLQDEAEALNQQAQEVTDQVKGLMESASAGEPDPAT